MNQGWLALALPATAGLLVAAVGFWLLRRERKQREREHATHVTDRVG